MSEKFVFHRDRDGACTWGEVESERLDARSDLHILVIKVGARTTTKGPLRAGFDYEMRGKHEYVFDPPEWDERVSVGVLRFETVDDMYERTLEFLV